MPVSADVKYVLLLKVWTISLWARQILAVQVLQAIA